MWNIDRIRLSAIIGTAMVFLLALAANEWIFVNSEFVRGINWIYLPAGVRLVCTLLFGLSGAIGLLIASWLACFLYFFPDDFIRALGGGAIAAAAPYLAYRLARRFLGFRADLGGLTGYRLVGCAVIYALSNTGLHHLWFIFRGDLDHWREGLAIMFIGDLNGAIILLYAMKLAIWLTSLTARRNRVAGNENRLERQAD